MQRRIDFADEFRGQVKPLAREMAKSLEWWFRDRYRLAPTDPRFLDATREQMLLDHWTAHYHHLIQSGKDIDEFEDQDWDLEKILADAENWEDA